MKKGVKLTVDDLPGEIFVDGNEFKFLKLHHIFQKKFSINYLLRGQRAA